MNTISEIADLIRSIRSAVIFTHTRPDGDTLGSGMALSRALTILGIENQVVNDSEIPQKFGFLRETEAILAAPTLDAEAYLVVDASDEARLGLLQPVFLAGVKKRKITVNVDHHVSNTRFCKYNFVRMRASNCENIAELIRAMGVPFDKTIANCLMLGVVTDSGAFSHADVNGDTFRTAAALADAGAEVGIVQYEAFKKQTRARAELYARVISRLRYFLGGAFAAAIVTRAMLDEAGLRQDATEGIVDFALTIDVVEVSVCLMEVKKGQYKASLRSKGKVDVNEVARIFGGGGHVLASGCMLFGDLEEIFDKLSFAVSQRLGS